MTYMNGIAPTCESCGADLEDGENVGLRVESLGGDRFALCLVCADEYDKEISAFNRAALEAEAGKLDDALIREDEALVAGDQDWGW